MKVSTFACSYLTNKTFASFFLTTFLLIRDGDDYDDDDDDDDDDGDDGDDDGNVSFVNMGFGQLVCTTGGSSLVREKGRTAK